MAGGGKMKILFVEDELAKNIPRLCILFDKFLGEKRLKKLKELDADTSGYGVSPEEIKSVVDDSQSIEVEYSFPAALQKIMTELDEYAVFIVDRNLAGSEYSFDTVHAIDPQFSNTLLKKYSEREGDYIFSKLLHEFHVDVASSFFFLTAYSADQVIRNEQLLENLIDLKQFKKENFIEKDNQQDLSRLKNSLVAFKQINIYNQNKEYHSILLSLTGRDTANSFLSIVIEKDNKKKVRENLNELRCIYEKIVETICRTLPDVAGLCLDSSFKIKSKGIDVPRILEEKRHANSIIRNFMTSIYKIGSDFGSHRDASASVYEPTTETVNALLYGLHDILRWLKQVDYQCQNNNPPKDA